MDERSEMEQVKSGFRIVGWMLLSFLVFVLLARGERWVLEPGEPYERPVGTVLLAGVAVLLYVGARRWLKWVIAACTYGAFRMVFGLLNALSVKRDAAGELAIFLLVLAGISVVGLTYFDREPSKVESAAATVLALLFPLSILRQSWVPILGGLACLAIARWAAPSSSTAAPEDQI